MDFSARVFSLYIHTMVYYLFIHNKVFSSASVFFLQEFSCKFDAFSLFSHFIIVPLISTQMTKTHHRLSSSRILRDDKVKGIHKLKNYHDYFDDVLRVFH